MRHFLVAAVLAAAVTFAEAAPAGAAMTGLVRLSPFTASTSENAKTLTATCPLGTKVVGVGGDTTPGNGSVLLDILRPSASLTTVSVHANEDQAGTAADWYLQAYAICAHEPNGLELVTATSPSSSSNKSVTATCPSGKRLLGSGAELTGARGQVILDGLMPNPGLTAVAVNALEDEGAGTAQSWSVTAYAICADPVAGLQRIVITGQSSSTGNRVVSAPCPSGKSVIGMGGTINSPNGQVVLDALFPDANLTGASVAAFEDATGNSASWTLSAYAICAARAELSTAITPRFDAEAWTNTSSCSPGRVPAGAGFDVTGGYGRVGLYFLIPAATYVASSARGYPTGDAKSWAMATQAICATPLPGQETVSLESPADSQTEKSVTVSCPAGTRVVGAGGAVNPDAFEPSEHVMVQGIVPNASLTKVTVTGREDEQGTGSPWVVDAYAVCASSAPGLQRVASALAPTSEESGQVIAGCPAGKHLIGTGGEVVGGLGQVPIDEIAADAALSRTRLTAYEDLTGLDTDWQLIAYGICINH